MIFAAEFGNELRAKGLVVDGDPMMDGQWHRTTVSTSRNAKALKGAYIGNLDGDLANGYIQNFDIGVAEAWFPKGVVISEERRQQFERQAEENRRVRDAELTAEREGVANKLGKKMGGATGGSRTSLSGPERCCSVRASY
ncbi:hypothetical protein ACFS07_36135 [Undibacterium arcticum]